VLVVSWSCSGVGKSWRLECRDGDSWHFGISRRREPGREVLRRKYLDVTGRNTQRQLCVLREGEVERYQMGGVKHCVE
jgi:hypothetical protein